MEIQSEWVCEEWLDDSTNLEALEAALEQLEDVRQLPSTDRDGSWVHWDSGMRRWYHVSGEQLVDLGLRILRGEADAYSLWCAAYVPEELTAEEVDRLELD